MICKEIQITKTGITDANGYDTAIMALYDETKELIKTKTIDSFQILDKVCIDFEGNGDIRIWPYDTNANAFLDVDDTYSPCIKVVKL